MAQVEDRRRESSIGLDPDEVGIDSVKWYEEQLEISRLSRPTDKQKVAAFVNTVEKAIKYFEFKDFLAKHCGWEEYIKYGAGRFVRLPSQINNFKALSTYDINAAVVAHIFSLRRQHRNITSTAPAPAPSPPKDPASTLLDRLKEEDSYAFSAPAFRVVFLALNRLYDMDLSAEKELQKIKSSSPDYNFFHEPTAKWSEKDVAKKYEEARNKYKRLVLGLSKEAKRRMPLPDKKRKREQNAMDGVDKCRRHWQLRKWRET